MAQSNIAVTAGAGTLIDSWTYSKGGSTVHDEFTIPGEYPYASYLVQSDAVSIGTANDHIMQLMAGSSLNVRIRRIRLEQHNSAASAGASAFRILRLTTAGTGGSAITLAKHDTADAAAGATGMTLPSSKGTESTILMPFTQTWRQAVSATGSPADDQGFEWVQHFACKPIIIPAGTSNGIAIKSLTAIASGTVDVFMEVVETTF